PGRGPVSNKPLPQVSPNPFGIDRIAISTCDGAMKNLHPAAALSALIPWLLTAVPGLAEVNKAESIAPGVYFHEGDIGRKGHCNNGWIVFDDYVLVVDGNFPSGAQEVIPKIKITSDKPIRFTFNTHHHGDHAYGNQIWLEN